MVDLARPQIAAEFRDDLAFCVAVLVPGDGRFEIARVRQAIGADRAEIGQAKLLAVVFADVAATALYRPDAARS